jgi:predicted RNase H-like nuclease
MVAAALPYKNIAGIVPCPGGWLIVPARLAGVTVSPDEPMVVRHLLDVLDYRPKFDAAAIYAPVGFFEYPVGPFRPCDEDARALVGWPRVVGIKPMPSRAALRAKTRGEARQIEPWLTNDDFRRFKWWRQAEQEFQPFHQRSFFSAHPDLSFTNLNGDVPLKTSPHHPDGLLERVKLIRDRLPGIEDIIMRPPPPGAGQLHLMQGCALLWTARRCAGRGMTRLPADPTWDDTGMRMELVR